MNDANIINPLFKKWALGFSGCDGGDIGSDLSRSIWLCGLEWGGDFEETVETLSTDFNQDVSQPPSGYKDWRENIAYIFNWQAMKLLGKIHDYPIEEYKKFAEEYKPFVNGQKGFFKMNLYPIAFKQTAHNLWDDAHKISTGLSTKQDYINWIYKNRFTIMQNLVINYSPKLIICTGVTYFLDFKQAFMIDNMEVNKECIDGKNLVWFKNENGTLVVVIPFMVNRNGLNSNATISNFGSRIKELLVHCGH